MKKAYFLVSFIFLSLIFFVAGFSLAGENGYREAKCVIHLHSKISSGDLTIEDYARLAEESGVDIVILTDNLLQRYEYGLWPLRGILKRTVEKPSILKYGAEKYLKTIEAANTRYKDVLIIDGAQVSPFYYWTGSIFKGNLALNSRAKDMLVIGLGNAKSYKGIPITGRRSSRFDQYHGDKFLEPYQDLIDYAYRLGGLTFWSHPEIEENLSMKGVRLITIPYSYDLLLAKGYTGFGIFPEGYNTVGTPGGVWDRILTEYCLGKRAQPTWAIGELEYSGEEDKNFDETMNILYVKKFDRNNILDALKEGRFYIVSKVPQVTHLALDEFSISEENSGRSAMMGQTLVSDGTPLVRVKLSQKEPIDAKIDVKLIRNGSIVKEFSGTGSADAEFRDEDVMPGRLVYYRIDAINGGMAHIISNPIFFRRVKEE